MTGSGKHRDFRGNRTDTFRALDTDKGRRLDLFLAEKLLGASRSLVQKYIGAVGRPVGQPDERPVVRVNGLPAKPNYRLRAGDLVEVELLPPKETRLEARRMDLRILYEDDDIIVVDKEAGVPVHPGAGHGNDTLVNALLHHSGETGSLSNIGGENRPGIVHRLDKDTAGVLLVAKTNVAHAALSRQFAERTTVKVYEAIVKGRVAPESGVLDGPIARSRVNRKKFAVAAHGREAVTLYKVLDTRGDTSLVRFFPKTGRTHQIRVHAASIGHPILGDRLYSRKAGGVERLALFAKSLTLVHPRTGQRLTFTAPYPGHFRSLAESLGYRLEGDGPGGERRVEDPNGTRDGGESP